MVKISGWCIWVCQWLTPIMISITMVIGQYRCTQNCQVLANLLALPIHWLITSPNIGCVKTCVCAHVRVGAWVHALMFCYVARCWSEYVTWCFGAPLTHCNTHVHTPTHIMHTAFVTHLSKSLKPVHHVMHSSSALKEACSIHYQPYFTCSSFCLCLCKCKTLFIVG